ncbi:hypothetical protein VNO78_08077 [Psophocarpus tetragonolobus]|uniref:Phototropic-responsive NPH3 family protein n=1 Tax=Psophocarpus tetragonolobus TaxID=3891 RepID=A0AAN9SUH5_PSOTE
MKAWNQFETIYEEEREFSSTSSPSLSPSSSSSPPSLHSLVNAWSLHSGSQPDIFICVQGTSFRLHKDRITSRSTYLKRHLTGVSNLTLSPPLNITAETFSAVAEFCYSHRIHLTASNVATIRVAAELLGMTEGENLRDVTESYFESVVGIEASMVLRSCLTLLPEAETTASLASRCIEALVWEDDVSCLDDVVRMQPQDFQTVVDSLNQRLPNHDVLYKMVDHYLKENEYGKVTEEQKTEICNSIDCSKVSSHTLVKCVQNPRMPLRLIVRAILMEHLNTRRSVVAAATGAQQAERTSLREILQRETAHRQAEQMKEAMDATYSRIQSLEKELKGMRKLLLDHNSNALNSERSVSFHFVPPETSKIQRGGRGSVSSSGFLLHNIIPKKNNQVAMCNHATKTPKITKPFRHSFITALKNAFSTSNLIKGN